MQLKYGECGTTSVKQKEILRFSRDCDQEVLPVFPASAPFQPTAKHHTRRDYTVIIIIIIIIIIIKAVYIAQYR